MVHRSSLSLLVSVALLLCAAACDQPKTRAEPGAAEPALSAKRPAIKSCFVKADGVCSEYGERPELAGRDCPAGGEVVQGPCPRDGRLGTCTILVSASGTAYTIQRVHYAGGRMDPEAQCKAASGTWAR